MLNRLHPDSTKLFCAMSRFVFGAAVCMHSGLWSSTSTDSSNSPLVLSQDPESLASLVRHCPDEILPGQTTLPVHSPDGPFDRGLHGLYLYVSEVRGH